MTALERLPITGLVPPWVRHLHRTRYVFASQFVSGKTVIDCACGSGEGSRALLEAGAARVEAFDISGAAVAEAQRRLGVPKLSFQIGDAAKLPLASGGSDVYVSFETIEHVREPEALLAEAVRVLKPGGLFISSTPNRTVTNPGKALPDHPRNPFHFREYARREFETLLDSFFSRVRLLGQNRVDSARISRWAWLNQIRKAPGWLLSQPGRHAVVEMEPGFEYEYLVAVCTR